MRMEAEGRRQAEAEARWAKDRQTLAEAEAGLRAEVERLRTRLEPAGGGGGPKEEVRRCASDAIGEL